MDDSDEASRYVTIWILGEGSLTKIYLGTFVGTLNNYGNLGVCGKRWFQF